MQHQDDASALKVFLSHAGEDKPKVRNLCKRLKADGFDPWLDEERLLPGQDWKLEIEKALRASGAILLCFSQESVGKEGFIQREYKRAMSIQEEKPEGAIFVIPVRLDKCEMPFFIRDLQWVDYPDGYDKLVAALNLRAGRQAEAKKAPEKKEPKPRKPAAPKDSGGPNIIVHGNINVGRDFVSHDQYKTVTHGETIYNVSTPTDFIAALNQLKAEIEALKSQPNLEPAVARRLTTVEGDIEDAMTEAGSEKPAVEKVKSTLEGAKDMMDKLGGSLGSAVKLGAALGQLAALAIKVFGG
jgi:hypothetical protein